MNLPRSSITGDAKDIDQVIEDVTMVLGGGHECERCESHCPVETPGVKMLKEEHPQYKPFVIKTRCIKPVGHPGKHQGIDNTQW